MLGNTILEGSAWAHCWCCSASWAWCIFTAKRYRSDWWVGHTNAWMIPGTEDLRPYITAKDKRKKWLFGTVGMAVIAAALSAAMMIFIR